MSVKKYKVLFWIVALVLVAAILFFLGKAAFFQVKEEFDAASYPLEYSEYVEKYASENDVDKMLIYAIIRTESGFDPESESNVGARGLMQIMEDTFDWIKFRLDDAEEISFDDMYDPETNIKYGCYLVGYLMRYFYIQDVAVCAYHAGIGNVESWLSNEEYSSDGVSLDVVATSDTEHYLNKINKALEAYNKIYITEEE